MIVKNHASHFMKLLVNQTTKELELSARSGLKRRTGCAVHSARKVTKIKSCVKPHATGCH